MSLEKLEREVALRLRPLPRAPAQAPRLARPGVPSRLGGAGKAAKGGRRRAPRRMDAPTARASRAMDGHVRRLAGARASQFVDLLHDEFTKLPAAEDGSVLGQHLLRGLRGSRAVAQALAAQGKAAAAGGGAGRRGALPEGDPFSAYPALLALLGGGKGARVTWARVLRQVHPTPSPTESTPPACLLNLSFFECPEGADGRSHSVCRDAHREPCSPRQVPNPNPPRSGCLPLLPSLRQGPRAETKDLEGGSRQVLLLRRPSSSLRPFPTGRGPRGPPPPSRSGAGAPAGGPARRREGGLARFFLLPASEVSEAVPLLAPRLRPSARGPSFPPPPPPVTMTRTRDVQGTLAVFTLPRPVASLPVARRGRELPSLSASEVALSL